MKRVFMGTLSLWFFLLAACGSSAPPTTSPAVLQNGIEIYAPSAGAKGAGEDSAAFMSIKNTGTEADTLLSAACDAAASVQIMNIELEGDTFAMVELPGIDVPAGSTVELNASGYHIMLTDLKQELKNGSTIRIVLEFAKAGAVNVDAAVKPFSAIP
jgi:periplasmic copper chaperone A